MLVTFRVYARPAPSTAVDYLRKSYPVSGNRACELLYLAVSSYYYQTHGLLDGQPVGEALRRHAAVRRRWGDRRLLVLLRREGFGDNHKRVHRLYRAEGLQVRQRRRRKQRLARGLAPAVAPQRANERWSLDFAHDRQGSGRSLRLLTVHDDYTVSASGSRSIPRCPGRGWRGCSIICVNCGASRMMKRWFP